MDNEKRAGAPGTEKETSPETQTMPAASQPGSSQASTARLDMSDDVSAQDEGLGVDGQAPAKKKSGRAALGRRKLGLILLAGIGVLVLIFSSMGDKPTETAKKKPSAKATASPAANAPAKVGQVVTKGNLEFSVVSTRSNVTPTNPAQKVPEGQRIYAVEFRLTNKDTRPANIAVAAQFGLRNDKGRYKVTDIATIDPRFPDGIVAAGETAQGWISFLVPQDAGGLKLVFNPTRRGRS